jgi:hypothetical protein
MALCIVAILTLLLVWSDHAADGSLGSTPSWCVVTPSRPPCRALPPTPIGSSVRAFSFDDAAVGTAVELTLAPQAAARRWRSRASLPADVD